MVAAPTPLLNRAVIPCLRNYGVYEHEGDVGVFFRIMVSDEKDMTVFFRDLSKRMLASERLRASEGFRTTIPDAAAFPAGFDAARMVNKLNANPAMIGAFTADEDYGWLGFALETLVPKDSAAPEHVKIAMEIVVNTAIWLYGAVEEIDLSADDWDIEDILSAWPLA